MASRQRCLAQLRDCVADRERGCVLVEGEGGSGKSVLLKVLSEQWGSGRREGDLVVLHMGEQIDSKVIKCKHCEGYLMETWSCFRFCWVRLRALEFLGSLCGCLAC